jgi:hypothetical protein
VATEVDGSGQWHHGFVRVHVEWGEMRRGPTRLRCAAIWCAHVGWQNGHGKGPLKGHTRQVMSGSSGRQLGLSWRGSTPVQFVRPHAMGGSGGLGETARELMCGP